MMYNVPLKLCMFVLLLCTVLILSLLRPRQDVWDITNVYQSTRQLHRQNMLKSVCRKNNLTTSPYSISKLVGQRLFVEHRHKFIYCEVPKVGCSNWKRLMILLQMNLSTRASDLEHSVVHGTTLLKKLSNYSPNEQKQMLRIYTKVIFTRDPFERLVSAYRDKMLHQEDYYGITVANKIKTMFRKPKYFNASVMFGEFINYIIEETPTERDIHWMPMYQLCDPCNIEYDVIGRFDTMRSDVDHVLKTIRAPQHITYPSIRHYPNESRTNQQIINEYFRNLSTTSIERLIDIYKLDFSMFGYRPMELESQKDTFFQEMKL